VDPRRRHRLQTRRRQVLQATGIFLALVFFSVVAGGYVYGWKWTGFPSQKLWNWLELLIIPAALGVGTAWLNSTQRQRERREEERQRELERYIQDQRAQDDALQSYLDYMSKLLIDEKLLLELMSQVRPLYEEEQANGTRSKKEVPYPTQEQEFAQQVQIVLRARTLALLTRLEDTRRKVSLSAVLTRVKSHHQGRAEVLLSYPTCWCRSAPNFGRRFWGATGRDRSIECRRA
jgi:hypothetical protein